MQQRTCPCLHAGKGGMVHLLALNHRLPRIAPTVVDLLNAAQHTQGSQQRVLIKSRRTPFRQDTAWHAEAGLAPARQQHTPDRTCSAPGELLGGGVGVRFVADRAAAQLGGLVQREGRVAGDALAGVHHCERDLALCTVQVRLVEGALALRGRPPSSQAARLHDV